MLSPVFPRLLLWMLPITSGLAELPLGYNYLGRSRERGPEYSSLKDSFDIHGQGSYNDFAGTGYRQGDFGHYKGDAYSTEGKFGGNHALTHYLNSNLQALYRDMLAGNPGAYHHEYNDNLGTLNNGYESYPTEENYRNIRGYSESGNLKGLNLGTRDVSYKFSTQGIGSYLGGANGDIGNSEIGSTYNSGENYDISGSLEGSAYNGGDNYYRSRGNFRGYGSNTKGYSGVRTAARYRRGRYAGHPGGYYSSDAKRYRTKHYPRGLGYAGEFKGYNAHTKGSSIKPYALRGGHRGNSYITNSQNGFTFGNEENMHGYVNVGQGYRTIYDSAEGDFGEDGDGYSHSSKGYKDIHVEHPYSSYGEHQYTPRGYARAVRGYRSGISDYKFEDASGVYP